jgi:hypothetical protein
MLFGQGENTLVISGGEGEGDWRIEIRAQHAAKFTAPGRRKTEMKFVREDSQRHLAFQTHIRRGENQAKITCC